MNTPEARALEAVRAVYAGAEGDLWELLMGHQLHLGGFKSTMELAARAGIGAGMTGVDLCCCNGAGMRALVRFRDVATMTGIDATAAVVARGNARCAAEGLADRVRVVHADACASGLPGAAADFVWGEDAWCYVYDKRRLIAEAARIVKAGGTIAFSDWVLGATPMTDAETARYFAFMRFPNVASIDQYAAHLAAADCTVELAEDTGRFAPCVDLYLAMVDQQLTWDVLRLVGFQLDVLTAIGTEMQFLRELAHAGKIAQGRFVARRRS